jgi:hypothetical protein
MQPQNRRSFLTIMFVNAIIDKWKDNALKTEDCL